MTLAHTLVTTAMMCPTYLDMNTSSIVMTFQIGSTVLMTRHVNCIGRPINEDAEGNWQVAKGFMRTNASTGAEITSNFGFHETGILRGNTIQWSNGAEWRVRLSRYYRTLDETLVTVTPIDDRSDLYEVKSNENGPPLKMAQICEDLFLGGMHGKLKGGYIVWDDGVIWESISEDDDDDDDAFSYELIDSAGDPDESSAPASIP